MSENDEDESADEGAGGREGTKSAVTEERTSSEGVDLVAQS